MLNFSQSDKSKVLTCHSFLSCTGTSLCNGCGTKELFRSHAYYITMSF